MSFDKGLGFISTENEKQVEKLEKELKHVTLDT